MPRTLNPAAHALKRDAFLDAAERLIRTKGYEQMTVQDVLDELGASKGAFYHYFDSKEALLGGRRRAHDGRRPGGRRADRGRPGPARRGEAPGGLLDGRPLEDRAERPPARR